jgi:hypothetical protein
LYVSEAPARLTYQNEATLPAYYNEGYTFDPDTETDLPVRILDYYYFCDAKHLAPVPLEHLSTCNV